MNDMLITGPEIANPDATQGRSGETAPATPTLPTVQETQPVQKGTFRPRRAGLPGWVRTGLVALLVAALAVGGVLLVQQRDHDARQRAAEQALAAAQTAVVAVLSYDYRHLDEDFAAAEALTAQPFTAEYQRTTAKAVRPVAVKNAAVVKASLSAAGVVRATADRVVVLAFVNQTTSSSRLQRPQVDQNRVELTMVRHDDGRWLVAGVRAM
jgi:Mce-associated membrane protein